MNPTRVKTPLIGLTASARNEQGRFQVPAIYCEAVVRSGGAPVLLPPIEVDVKTWLARLDGLILTGGPDVDPQRYGGREHALNAGVDRLRDRCEMAMVHDVVRSGLPTLAICRGMQVVNVALGGTLLADITEEIGQTVVHRQPACETLRHRVAVEPESRLAGILGARECSPVSRHHQAIDRLGEGLRVVARAADGIIEAVELPETPWLVAVQWHPELSAASDPTQQRLFDHLVQQAAQWGNRRALLEEQYPGLSLVLETGLTLDETKNI